MNKSQYHCVTIPILARICVRLCVCTHCRLTSTYLNTLVLHAEHKNHSAMCVSPITMWTIPKWWNTCPKKEKTITPRSDKPSLLASLITEATDGIWWIRYWLSQPSSFLKTEGAIALGRCIFHFFNLNTFQFGGVPCTNMFWVCVVISIDYYLYHPLFLIYIDSNLIFSWYILCSHFFSSWLNKKTFNFITSPFKFFEPRRLRANTAVLGCVSSNIQRPGPPCQNRASSPWIGCTAPPR